MRRIAAMFAAAALVLISGAAPGEAGSSLSGRSFSFRTNPGGTYALDYGLKFHTNPGGKYVFRGQGRKFHTNPGLKYVYPGYTTAP